MCLTLDDFYSPITKDDHDQDRVNLPFSDHKIRAIQDMLRESEFLYTSEDRCTICIKRRRGMTIFYHNIKIANDEYYYVNVIPCYYKCDQFDGLLRFIRDVIIGYPLNELT